ncbi:MAG: two-component system, OmpR family, sensor kinase [Microbacteriaceae bacterium]|jgi:signal transduction histidine kinase|nr:two-component system, OmpR family, sensor kinase [Microbacteriaceae bacterium]
MRQRHPKRIDADARATHRASRIVGTQITIASGALALAAIGAAFIFVLHQLRPAEVAEAPRPGDHKIYIDTTEALIGLIVVGVLAVVIAGVLSALFTRRAVSPIAQALRMQRTFVQDASHELRTPLAVLDARLQILQRTLAPNDPTTTTVSELRADTRDLINVVNDLLLVADTGNEADNTLTSPLAPAISHAVDAMRVLADPRGITIRLDVDANPASAVPPTSLQRCITALLDNALTHSPDASTITVSVTTTGTHAVITVADHGAGIQGIDPDHIFDRFAHSSPPPDASPDASPRRRSSGIGLALVRDIATRHGGTIRLVQTSPSGSTFELRLPLR